MGLLDVFKKKQVEQPIELLIKPVPAKIERTYVPTYSKLVEITTVEGEFKEFLKVMNEPHIAIVIGKKNSGKTSLMFRIVENRISKTNEFAYIIGFPIELPDCFIHLNQISLVPNNAEALIDEAGIVLPAGTTVSKKQRIYNNLFMTAFHQHLKFTFTVQNSYNISVNALRQADALLVKEPGLFQMYTERPFVNKFCKRAKEHFKAMPKSERKKQTYVISDEWIGLMSNALPSFWSQKIREGFRRPF